MGLVKTFVTNVVPAVIKPLRVLWNEIIGFFFFVIFVFALSSGWKHYKNFDGSLRELLVLISMGFFLAMLLGYGLFSFLRARKISRS